MFAAKKTNEDDIDGEASDGYKSYLYSCVQKNNNNTSKTNANLCFLGFS